MTPQTIDELVEQWHESGRAAFAARCPALADQYDTPRYGRHIGRRGKKYICLDEGTSGMFMVDVATGYVYAIKGYGTIDRRKLVGKLGEITADDLTSCRYMKPNIPVGQEHHG